MREAAKAARKAKRKKQPRKVVRKKKAKKGKKKAKKSGSAWAAAGGDSKKQIMGKQKRKDIRDPEAFLGYLKKVKAGLVAPGQPG